MPEVKGYVTYVLEDGTEVKARVLAKRSHNVPDGAGGTTPVDVLDLKIMNTMPGVEDDVDPNTGRILTKGRVKAVKGVKQGTDPGCWHE